MVPMGFVLLGGLVTGALSSLSFLEVALELVAPVTRTKPSFIVGVSVPLDLLGPIYMSKTVESATAAVRQTHRVRRESTSTEPRRW